MFNPFGPGWFLLLNTNLLESDNIFPVSIDSEESFGMPLTVESCIYVSGHVINNGLVPAITVLNRCIYKRPDVKRRKRIGFFVCNDVRCN